MNPLYAILLGVIQGLTEFLPISSTAHLTLAGKLFGFIDPQHPESWTAFIAVMQLGTLAAVVAYFRRDLLSMVVSLIRDIRTNGGGEGLRGYSPPSRLAFLIMVGTLPVVVIGFGLHKLIEGYLTKNLWVIASSLIALALLLWLAERISRHQKPIEQITWLDSLLVGVAQALALIPGSSRSGTTITAGLFLGLTRDGAARFSFLLSIPAVLASGLYEMLKIYKMMTSDAVVFELGVASLIISTVVSAVTGYVAIAWLLRYLMHRTTMIFVYYRVALGILLLLLLFRGVVTP